jgi:outer membrane protein assembly factor BamB
MKRRRLIEWIPIGLGVYGALAIWFWWNAGARRMIKPRLPGEDRASGRAMEAESVRWEGTLARGKGEVASNLFGMWPCFRGPNLSGISQDTTPLAKAWGPAGPKVLWRVDVDEGYAGAAIWKGRVFVLDYDPKTRADALRCLSLGNGGEIWRYSYPV